MILTARDRWLLTALDDFRFLSVSQIEELSWAEVDLMRHFPQTRDVTNQRIKILENSNFIHRFPDPRSGHTQGRPEFIYTLGAEGARALRTLQGEVAYFRYPSQLPDPEHLRHFLGVNAVRVALTIALRTHPSQRLIAWRYDDQLRLKSPTGQVMAIQVPDPKRPARKSLELIPDGLAITQAESHRSYYFLEVDRATETLAEIRRKLQAYSGYFRSGTFAEHYQEPLKRGFRVLLVGPSRRRADTFVQVIKEQAEVEGIDARFFYAAAAPEITSATITGPIWWNPLSEAPQAIF